MRNRAFFTILTSGFLVTVGCSQPMQGKDYYPEIAELHRQIDALRAEKQETQKSINRLTSQLWSLSNTVGRFKTATFDPVVSEGFQRIDTMLGTVVVSIQNIEPYANGVRVRVSIGNLTAATLTDLGGSARYGGGAPTLDFAADQDAPSKYDTWNKSLKDTAISFTRDIEPASWNNVVLTLPGVKSTDFGHLEITLDATALKLRKGS